MAVLILLAAAAGTRLITTHARSAVTDRLRLLVAAGVGRRPVRPGRRPAVAAGGGRRRGPRRRLVDRGPDLPQRLLETFLLFHPEDAVGHLVIDRKSTRLNSSHVKI